MVFGALIPFLFFFQAQDAHQNALVLYRQHQYAKAAEMLEHAVTVEPKDSEAYRESVLLLAQSYYL
jgi:hypothetical protein